MLFIGVQRTIISNWILRHPFSIYSFFHKCKSAAKVKLKKSWCRITKTFGRLSHENLCEFSFHYFHPSFATKTRFVLYDIVFDRSCVWTYIGPLCILLWRELECYSCLDVMELPNKTCPISMKLEWTTISQKPEAT